MYGLCFYRTKQKSFHIQYYVNTTSCFFLEERICGIYRPTYFIIIIIYHLMQCICNYMLEANHISRVADTLWLQYTVHVMLFPMINVLYFYITTFRSKCAAPSKAVFRSSLMSCFSGVVQVVSE